MVVEFNCRLTNWYSSTRAELAAIWTALLTTPENFTAIIKTDSQAAIDGITKALSINKMNTQAFLKLLNRTLITNIVHTIRSKSINCHLIKIKGHSGLEGNERADHLAKLGSYSNLTLDVDNQDLCSKFHISLTW